MSDAGESMNTRNENTETTQNTNVGNASANAPEIVPDPKYTPEQVIEIQLNALKNNDAPSANSGIATTFRFASPGNRAYTGPLTRFIGMIHNPLYEPLLNHKKAKFSPLNPSGSSWRIEITDHNDQTITYGWGLSMQREEPYANCWMTDSVTILQN
eukprot:TRINITY_DN12831_c0_g1_i1.p1 TRINITY_DN12831_c0_g1~~TRINITY_DN12831_c0_g1_i1.p1  ORF type:complete len:156 (-),score=26.22 TRINITY_DN12831_c0_g1_i1:58-525(-)